MRQVWTEQSRPGAQFSTHVLPVASEERALVKIETQGLFSNIQHFSALLLIPMASLASREDWNKHSFADKEGNDDFRVFSQILARTMSPLSSWHNLPAKSSAPSRCLIATKSCCNHPGHSCRTFWLPKSYLPWSSQQRQHISGTRTVPPF